MKAFCSLEALKACRAEKDLSFILHVLISKHDTKSCLRYKCPLAVLLPQAFNEVGYTQTQKKHTHVRFTKQKCIKQGATVLKRPSIKTPRHACFHHMHIFFLAGCKHG